MKESQTPSQLLKGLNFLTEEEDDLEQAVQKPDEDEKEDEVPSEVSAKECLEALARVRSFGQSHGFSCDMLYKIKEMENSCLSYISEAKIQPQITQFFKKA